MMQIDSGSQPQAAAQQPAPQPKPAASPMGSMPSKGKGGGLSKAILAPIVIIVLIAAVAGAYFVVSGQHATISTTTSTIAQGQSSTINQAIYSLTACGNISSSGSYSLDSAIKTSISKGACINVMANNVKLACGGNRIVGSGPFDALPPYTYGILITGSNVSVEDCSVSNFSYGVAAFSAKHVTVSNNNASFNYMANIYLNGTSNSTIQNNYMTHSLSWQGSLFLSNRSSSNYVYNNTIAFDQVYGINVSASGDTFDNNRVNSTSQFAFYCSPSDSYTTSGSAKSNICFDNFGCAFLSCKGSNLPANITKISLSSGIFGCGSIVAPGTYSLEQDINMGLYLNVSNPASTNRSIPCIAIRAQGVTLNCNGHAIYNATYPIGVFGQLGASIENCRIRNATGYGISLISSPNATISNVQVSNAKLGGIQIVGSDSDNVTNSSFSRSGYGVVINASQSDNLLGVNSSKNVYGIYLSSTSIGNNFYHITAFNNSKIDVYAIGNATGAQTNFVSGMSCYSTNTKWATCTTLVVANLSYTPLTGCFTMANSGTYKLQQNLIDIQDNCMKITANNVALNCGNYKITAHASSSGYGLVISNATNVKIENCTFQNFEGGISVQGGQQINLSYDSVLNSQIGILLNNTKSSVVKDDSLNSTDTYGIQLLGTTGTKVLDNYLIYGPGATGISLNNSRFNILLNNTVSSYHYGLGFAGHSGNNTVSNNTASTDGAYDYYCSGNSNLSAEQGGINYGGSKEGCRWMALIQHLNPNPPCSSTSAPDVFSLSSDYVYPFGSTCFTINNNATTINCNGHTIIATNGGTFASVSKGASGAVIEGCNLKGFSAGVSAKGSARIYNNTILQSGGAVGITINGFNSQTVQQNNVTGGQTSYAVYNAADVNLQGDYAYRSSIAYYLYNATGVELTSDYAASSTYNGAVLNNSQSGIIRETTLLSSVYGLSCFGSSKASSSTTFTDAGQNSCGQTLNCGWIPASGC